MSWRKYLTQLVLPLCLLTALVVYAATFTVWDTVDQDWDTSGEVWDLGLFTNTPTNTPAATVNTPTKTPTITPGGPSETPTNTPTATPSHTPTQAPNIVFYAPAVGAGFTGFLEFEKEPDEDYKVACSFARRMARGETVVSQSIAVSVVATPTTQLICSSSAVTGQYNTDTMAVFSVFACDTNLCNGCDYGLRIKVTTSANRKLKCNIKLLIREETF